MGSSTCICKCNLRHVKSPFAKPRMVNCSNQELHVIHIILQINDPSSASPRQREDVPSRHWLRDSPGLSVVLGSVLGAAKEALLSLKTGSSTGLKGRDSVEKALWKWKQTWLRGTGTAPSARGFCSFNDDPLHLFLVGRERGKVCRGPEIPADSGPAAGEPAHGAGDPQQKQDPGGLLEM